MSKPYSDIKHVRSVRRYGKHYKWHPLYWRFQLLVKYKKWQYKREMDLDNAYVVDPEATEWMGETVYVSEATWKEWQDSHEARSDHT